MFYLLIRWSGGWKSFLFTFPLHNLQLLSTSASSEYLIHSFLLVCILQEQIKCLNIGPLWIKMIHIDLLIVVFSQKQSEERLKARCLMNPVKLIWARCETSILAEKEQFQNRAENICGKVWCSLWTQRWLCIQ